EREGVHQLRLRLMRPVGREHTVERLAVPVELLDRIIEQAADVRADAPVLVRLGETRVVAKESAQRIAAGQAPVMREALLVRHLAGVVLALRFRQRVLAVRARIDIARWHARRRVAVDDVERLGQMFAWIGDDVWLVVCERSIYWIDVKRDDRTGVLDAAINLLVHIPECDRTARAELMLEP